MATELTASRRPALGALLIAEALLSFAPLLILGPAIGWPASLGRPAAEQMVAIQAHAGMVSLGYAVYLLYSLLVAPLMIGLAARVFGTLARGVPATIAAFAALSVLARAIGILRWLTAMPSLAAAHALAAPDARAQIETVFDALNRYGGGIGEVLGVSLLMAVAMAALAIGAWREGGMPKWLCAFAAITALALAALSLPVFGGPALVPVAAAVSMLSAWMLITGVWCLRIPRGW
jgi:hypothetical protein